MNDSTVMPLELRVLLDMVASAMFIYLCYTLYGIIRVAPHMVERIAMLKAEWDELDAKRKAMTADD